MSFWDTANGHNLADILIRTLPKLAAKADRRAGQYTELLADSYEAMDYVAKEVAAGNRYVGHLTCGECGGMLVIMERKINCALNGGDYGANQYEHIELRDNEEDASYWQTMRAEMKQVGIEEDDIELAIRTIKKLRTEGA